MQTRHLGDGLYAVYNGWNVELRANSLENPTDKVYLEDWVLMALIKYAYEVGFLEKPEEAD